MRRFLAPVLFFLLSSEAHAQWWWPFGPTGTYEECMVAEMRGQINAMYQTVHKVCARRYKKEVSVYLSDSQYTWYGRKGFAHITALADEYVLTRMEARFSLKMCAESKEQDFTQPKSAMFEGGQTIIDLQIALSFEEAPKCMKGFQAWGMYK